MWFGKQTLKQVRTLMWIHLFYLAGGEKEKCYIKKAFWKQDANCNHLKKIEAWDTLL